MFSSAQPNHVPVAEDIPSEHTALTGEETGEDRDEPFGDAADVWSLEAGRPSQVQTASFLLYNIAGLVSKLSDADWMAYVESFDFVTLTETFIDENFYLSHVFTDYVKFVSPAIKLSHQGRRSGGILVMVRKNMSSFVQEIGVQYHNIVVLKLSKEVFGCDRDIMYIATCIPPPGSPFYDLSQTASQIAELDTCINELLSRM